MGSVLALVLIISAWVPPAVRGQDPSVEPARGFAVGQTVPDIPLYDLQGQEHRLGELLGRPYIIFGWASW